uniref:Uncharacterized protein n=1 Tax=Arundo donax TaxID=35708 RepID=A0A0A9H990_ARUDO
MSCHRVVLGSRRRKASKKKSPSL